MTENRSLLRALRLNAIFSGVSAVLLLITAGWVARQMGLPGPTAVYVVAGMLLLFSLHLFSIVRSRRIRTAEIVGIIAGDLLWVAGSVVMVALFYRGMTTAGLLLVDIVAVAVATFAVLQIRGLRAHLSRQPTSG